MNPVSTQSPIVFQALTPQKRNTQIQSGFNKPQFGVASDGAGKPVTPLRVVKMALLLIIGAPFLAAYAAFDMVRSKVKGK